MAEGYDELDPEGREADREDARLLEALDKDAQAAHFRDLLQDERVRDVLWRLLTECGIYNSIYSKSYGDMAMLEGRRQIGLWLLTEICESDPRAEMRMREKAIAVKFAAAEKERIARQRPKPRT